MSGPNELLSNLYGTANTQQAPVESEQEKVAAAQLQEADFLGRVMAHSYAQELNKLASGEVAPEPVQPAVDPQFDAAAEKLAMDILHESGYNPFTLDAYGTEQEKVATAQAWNETVQEQEKVASAEDQLVSRAWEMLNRVGFQPGQ